MPNDTVQHLPFGTFGMLFYGLIILSKVTDLPSTSAWDQSIAQKEADLVRLATGMKRKVESVAQSLGRQPSRDEGPCPFEFYAKLMDSLLSWRMKQPFLPNDQGQLPDLLTDNQRCLTDHCPALGVAGPANNAASVPTESSNIAVDYSFQSDPALDLSPSQWNDLLWQATLEELSFFPQTLPTEYPADIFATHGYPPG